MNINIHKPAVNDYHDVKSKKNDGCLVGQLVYWLLGWLAGLMVAWLVGWFIGCFLAGRPLED